MDSIGTRIRDRMAELGVPSQRELARTVDMKPDALSRAMSGERGFSITELVALAETLNTSLHWLATGSVDPNELSVAARHGYDHSRQSRVAVDWPASRPVLENIAVAYEQVDRDLPVRIGGPIPRAARDVRQCLEAASGDSFVRVFADAIEAAFPVDVVRASEVDGGFTIQVGRRTILAINDTSNWFRQNWSLAHELGHVAAGTMGSIAAPSQDLDRSERNANAFAAELLLPAAHVKAQQWHEMTHTDVAEFIWQHGISTKALASRLEALRIDIGAVGWELRSESTQRFIRKHLINTGESAETLISTRMQEAGSRRFPIGLLTAHRDAIEDGRLHGGTLAWMLDDDVDEIEAELLPTPSADPTAVDELSALLGFEE